MTILDEYDIFDLLIGSSSSNDFGKKPVLIRGMTGNFGSTHTRLMKAYGTNIVAGVTPGKGGKIFEGIPVFDSVAAACENVDIKISQICTCTILPFCSERSNRPRNKTDNRNT